MIAVIVISGLVKTNGKQNAAHGLVVNMAKGRIAGSFGPSEGCS